VPPAIKAVFKRSAERRPPLSPFQKYFLGALVPVALLIAGGGYWAYQELVIGKREQALAQLSQDFAAGHAAQVARRIEDIRSRLRGLARGEALNAALAANDGPALEMVRTNLHRELPALRGLRFYQKGGAVLDREAETPIRFAELDMLNRAERRETVLAEASQAAGELRISLVEAIPFAAAEAAEQSAVTGVVFASISAVEVFAATEALPGKIQILQRYPGQQPQVVHEYGDAAAGQSQEAPVANSFLLVRFSPSAPLLAQVGGYSGPFFAGLAVALLLGLALATAFARWAAGRAAVHTGTGERPREPDNILDLEVSDEDRELLGIRAMVQRTEEEDPLDIQNSPLTQNVPAEIFRSYDIRGVAGSQLTPANVVLIGQAIGSTALAAGEASLVVARDGRKHSPEIAEQLVEGILATGCDVVNIGMVPTPLMYFACHELGSTKSGVMVTASHNPPEYNGFKIVIGGDTLKDESIQALLTRIDARDFRRGAGKEHAADMTPRYIDRIFSDLALAGEISVVVDAGNGVTGELAPRLFEELGCSVTPLYCEVDGDFPNHQPDPSVAANLEDLVSKVKEVNAHLGIALDGDGDRVVVVTSSGQIVAPDRLLMLLAKDIVSRNPGGDVIFDVKCSRELNRVITSYGGRPIMWKSGHSHMKAKMKETSALLGGELSGHIFIKERWYGFDDGLYAAARVIEIMSLREQDLDSILENFPALPATPEIKIPVNESDKFALLQQLIRKGDFGEGRLTTMDGLRVDFPEGWGLVRPSNTSAALTLRFEAESEAALEKLVGRFKQQLAKLEPKLELNF
jgi:phosphomannomutase/phosphoglucomutase